MQDEPLSSFAARCAEAHDLITTLDQQLCGVIDRNSGWDKIQLRDVEGLKHVVDHVRHTLWACIIGLEQHAEHHAGAALREYRKERVRDMLRELRSDSSFDPTVDLFMAEVKRIIEA